MCQLHGHFVACRVSYILVPSVHVPREVMADAGNGGIDAQNPLSLSIAVARLSTLKTVENCGKNKPAASGRQEHPSMGRHWSHNLWGTGLRVCFASRCHSKPQKKVAGGTHLCPRVEVLRFCAWGERIKEPASL